VSILFDTGTVAPHERFDFWTASSDRAFFPCTFTPRDPLVFSGTMQQYIMGPLTVSRVTSAATAVSRRWSDIGKQDPEGLLLALQLSGRARFGQHGREQTITTGEMVLYDTSHPFTITTNGPYDFVVLACPRALLGRRASDSGSRLVTPLEGGVATAFVAPFIARLLRGLVDGSVSEGDTDLGESGAYLLRALCRDTAPASHAASTCAADLLTRVKAYIDEHIADPHLRPDAIAAGQYISTRYLQKLFKAEGVTVTDWIRERRLAGCRRDLRDPAYAADTILAIATRWGLTNAAHFSRLVRAQYGCTPREFRSMHGLS
jgi:AraC-like DNA-binding protein